MKTSLTTGDRVRRTSGSGEIGRVKTVYSKYAMVEFEHSHMILQSLLPHNDLEVVDDAVTRAIARKTEEVGR